MPITPRYTLSQTPTHIQITASIPHVRVSPSTLELVIDSTDVHLYAPPTYLLKLTLPDAVVDEETFVASTAATNKLVQDSTCDDEDVENITAQSSPWSEDDLPKLQYDPCKNHGTIIITLRKIRDGIWDDLDLLGRLQRPLSKNFNTKPLIICEEEQDVDSQIIDNENSRGIMDELNSIHPKMHYGLFRTHYNVFKDYAREGLASEMLECPNPDNDESNDRQERRQMRLDLENDKFDAERYAGDLFIEQDMIFDSAMHMEPHWTKPTTNEPFFTKDESHLLATLPQKETIPILNPDETKSILLTLADLLFAYAYDHRTTDGEATIESSWTIMILSPTLSWLEHYNAPYDTIHEVMKWCIRRSLIYPYLRNYNLAMKVVNDVGTILSRGRRTVIRSLLQMHSIVERSECHYLFNKLYVDPMIWWVQGCEEGEVCDFGREFCELLLVGYGHEDWEEDESNLLGKRYLGLGLVELEQALFDDSDDEEDSSSGSDDESSSGRSESSDTGNEALESNQVEHKTMVQLMQTLDIDTTNEN